MGYMQPDTLCSNLVKIARNASLFHLGVLSSTMRMAWVRYTCGRLESRYRYSKDIVYNNFPWPEKPSEVQTKAIEAAAQNVSDVRSHFPKATLATPYDPDLMPPDLVKAHERLDRAVDAAYVPDGGKRKWASDAERVAFLFRRYRELDSLLPDQRSRSRSEGTKRSRRGEV